MLRGDVSHTVAPVAAILRKRPNVHREVNNHNYAHGILKRKCLFYDYLSRVERLQSTFSAPRSEALLPLAPVAKSVYRPEGASASTLTIRLRTEVPSPMPERE